jgi:hypothetical protein
MRNFMSILAKDGQNVMLKAENFNSVAEYVGYVFNNADKFLATSTLTDSQLNNLEQFLVFAYNLGYGHGEDYMDGKRPQDFPLPFFQEQYSEHGGD